MPARGRWFLMIAVVIAACTFMVWVGPSHRRYEMQFTLTGIEVGLGPTERLSRPYVIVYRSAGTALTCFDEISSEALYQHLSATTSKTVTVDYAVAGWGGAGRAYNVLTVDGIDVSKDGGSGGKMLWGIQRNGATETTKSQDCWR
jgi:hypothetical protein